MLAKNRGDVALATKLDAPKLTPPVAEAPQGKIGFGSWHTQVEYSDVSVTGADGRTLFSPDSLADVKGWDFTGGDWRVFGRSLVPVQMDGETWAIIGEPNWSDYTIRLRARKLGGREGFIVIFYAQDGNNLKWWNIGGWGNTVTRTESAEEGARGPYGDSSDFTVVTGRWYDLRLEVTGNRARGYVDGELVTDITYEPQPTTTAVYATATYQQADRTVLVKVVNAGKVAADTTINLRGAGRVEPEGTAIVLAGEPKDVNTVAEPQKVAPKEEAITNASASFRRTFPPYSFTILRLKTGP